MWRILKAHLNWHFWNSHNHFQLWLSYALTLSFWTLYQASSLLFVHSICALSGSYLARSSYHSWIKASGESPMRKKPAAKLVNSTYPRGTIAKGAHWWHRGMALSESIQTPSGNSAEALGYRGFVRNSWYFIHKTFLYVTGIYKWMIGFYTKNHVWI